MRAESTAPDVSPLGFLMRSSCEGEPSHRPLSVRSDDRGWYQLALPRVRPEQMEPVREIVRGHLRLWGKAELSFIAELGVTELLTNVYKHAGGGCELVISETACGIFVGVTDCHSALPVVREPTDDEAGGRGLFLLSAMADELVSEPRAGGKRVGFRLGPAAPEPGESA